MKIGRINGIAYTFLLAGDEWVNAIRLLVKIENSDDWGYVIIPACNYRFRQNDLLSWNDQYVIWYSGCREVVLLDKGGHGVKS